MSRSCKVSSRVEPCWSSDASSAASLLFTEHFLLRLTLLALQWAGLGGRTNFTFGWTTAFVFGLGRDDHFGFVLFWNRPACLYGRGVSADVPDELFTQCVFDHARVHTLEQFAVGKLFKGTAEGGLTGQRQA